MGALPYGIFLFITSLIATVLAYMAWQRREATGAKLITLLMLAVVEWSLSYMLQLVSTSLATKLFWTKLQYPGIVIIPLAWLALVLQYTGQARQLTLYKTLLLTSIPCLTVIMAWTNKYHHLFYNQVALDTTSYTFPTLKIVYGPWFWIHSSYSYILLATAALLIMQAFKKAPRLYRQQTGILLLGMLGPWVGNLLYLLNFSPLDLTPFAFTITGVLLVFGLVHYQLLEIGPMARDTVIESMKDGIIVLDTQGRILDFNPAAERILGHSVRQNVGKSVWQILFKTPYLSESYRKATEMRKEIILENGETQRYYDMHISPLYDRQGRVTGRLLVLRDTTQRKEAQEALQYRVAFEQLITNLSTKFISLPHDKVDQEIHQMLQAIAEFIGVDRSYIYLLTENNTTMECTYEWCAEGIKPKTENFQAIPTESLPWWMGRLERFENIFLHSVEDLPIDARAERVFLRAQKVQSVIVVPMLYGQDLIGLLGFEAIRQEREWQEENVTLLGVVGDIVASALKRQQAEQALHQSEATNQAILNAIPDLMFRIDQEGYFLDFKVSDSKQMYQPSETVLGSHLKDMLPGEVAKKALEHINKALTTGEVQLFEYQLELQDGSIHTYETRLVTINANEVLSIVRDISERARLERMKSDFINRASHELRTPLTTAILMVELLREGGPNQETEQYWKILKQELQRQKEIVEDLLVVGRLENGRLKLHPKALNLPPLLDEVISIMETRAETKKLALLSDYPHQLPSINGDQNGLKRVFVNLLDNAIKFTPAGGQIRLTTGKNREGINVHIRDTGIGIPPQDISELCGRFFRASNAIHKEIPGSGMGLYMVKSIVEELNGQVTVESELDAGTTVTVSLPYRKE
ncbi:MAG: PAS domain-containing protein [Anaerolineae bacterium]|nr:PAS domain-containing protein [Anaerolineae bacterium]